MWLQNHTFGLDIALDRHGRGRGQRHAVGGAAITAWDVHRACMGKGKGDLCKAEWFTDSLYEDDFTAMNAVALLRRRPTDKPFFLHVSFPGPHAPFLVTTDQLNMAAGIDWPNAADDKGHMVCAGQSQRFN